MKKRVQHFIFVFSGPTLLALLTFMSLKNITLSAFAALISVLVLIIFAIVMESIYRAVP